VISASGTKLYSASDLLTWLGCQHASALDALALSDRDLKAWLRVRREAQEVAITAKTDFPEPANVRGDEHEVAMRGRLQAEGLQIIEIVGGRDRLGDAVEETCTAMQEGADVIYQAALADGPWFGYADFLVKVEGRSAFGDYLYEVRDTKLARHATANALLQMAHYGAMVATLQGAPPPRLVVWLGDTSEFAWDYRDAAPYLDELRKRFLSFHDTTPTTASSPVDACGLCRWSERCEEEWGPEDVTHVHRLTRRHRTLLRDAGIPTIARLAEADATERPDGITASTFERLVAQATVQAGEESFALIRPQLRDGGIATTPAPHPLDLYFDLEGDPYAALPTLDYLWAYCDSEGNYEATWAHTAEQEHTALTWLLQELRRRDALGGDWHVYHYNSYEVTSLRRVAESFSEPDERLRVMLEVEHFVTTRFDDLYRRVEQGIRTRDGSTSLKIVEKLAGYDRSVLKAAVGRADDSIKAYEAYLKATDATEGALLLEGIRQYNEHDVLATMAVHRWLADLGPTLAAEDLLEAPVTTYVASDQVVLRLARTEHLQQRLRAAIVVAGGGDLPSGLSVGGANMLAAMLEWHRKETVVAYVDFLRLKDWTLDRDVAEIPPPSAELYALEGIEEPVSRTRGTEHESCLLEVTGPLAVGAPVTHRANEALLRTYQARPGSWKVKSGTSLEEALPEGASRTPFSLKIGEHDPKTGLFSFRKGTAPDDLAALVSTPFNDPEAVWEALMRLGEQALSPTPASEVRVALALLDLEPALPGSDLLELVGEPAVDRAIRLTRALRQGVLPVQGPPGTGKTWLAARLVLQEVTAAEAAGRSCVIGVVAGSHKVIGNLLVEIRRLADASHRTDLAIAHVGTETQVDTDQGITAISGGNGRLSRWIQARRSAGQACIVGATKFGWSRPGLASSVDLLLVDEAGQLSLADALAVTQASSRIVALGDPQQLAAPVQAARDEAVRVSLLEHLAQGHSVLPPEVGVFLDVTHRMHPDVCSVVGDLAYEGELLSSAAAANRHISGLDLLVAGRTVPIRPGVFWLPVDGGEAAEATAVAELVRQLQIDVHVTVDGTVDQLTLDEVLVVAPHNAHVNRIAAEVGPDVRVGTVDKFQGQQGHVVIYSMGRLADRPGDVPFLYDLNRVNVALSRARLMVIVVAHSDAVFPPVGTPDHLRLASRFAAALRGRAAETIACGGQTSPVRQARI